MNFIYQRTARPFMMLLGFLYGLAGELAAMCIGCVIMAYKLASAVVWGADVVLGEKQ